MASIRLALSLMVGLVANANSISDQSAEQSYLVDRKVIGNMKTGQQPESDYVAVAINREHSQVAELEMGSPAQKLTCLLDSGSSDLWLPSKRCQRCQNLNSFDADASSSFEGTRRAVKISYGSGDVVGYSVRDHFRLGSVQVQNQPFIIVEDAALPKRQWDGICGLGWKALSKVGPTLYENMQQQSLPARFSIVPTSNAARLVLGEMPSNASMKPNTLKWVAAEKYDPTGGFMGDRGRTFWVVSGGVQINAPQPVPARFLVDTGTNQVLMVPVRLYQTFIRSLIPSSLFDSLCGHDPRAGVICECSIMQQQLKPLRIHLGGHPFVLPVSKMFMKVPAKMGGNMCMLTIQPNTMTGGGSMPRMGSIGGILGSILGGIAGPTVRTGRRLQETLGQLLGDMLADQQAHQLHGGSQMSPSQGPSQASPSGQAPSITIIGMPPQGQSPPFGGSHGSERPQFVPTQIGFPPQHTRPQQPEAMPYGQPHSGQVPPVLGGGGQMPTAHAPGVDPNELWMIGGVFLEHFVTIFDFDNAQLGFAEPTSRKSNDRYSGLWESKGPVINDSQSSWLFDALASAAFAGFVLGSLLGFRSFRLQRARPDRFIRTSAEDVEQAMD